MASTSTTCARLKDLLARLNSSTPQAPKHMQAPKRSANYTQQDALVLAMMQVGAKLNQIKSNRVIRSGQLIVNFEGGAYSKMFERLVIMPWRCVELGSLGYWETSALSLLEALQVVTPVVFMLKYAHFALKDPNDARNWNDVLVAIANFERAYEKHTGEAFGVAVAVREFAGMDDALNKFILD